MMESDSLITSYEQDSLSQSRNNYNVFEVDDMSSSLDAEIGLNRADQNRPSLRELDELNYTYRMVPGVNFSQIPTTYFITIVQILILATLAATTRVVVYLVYSSKHK
jgi:hypothetical protein